MKKYYLEHDRAMELVNNIKNGVDVDNSYNTLINDSSKMRDYYRRKYLPIVMKYDLEFDDIEQEMLMAIMPAVENCPLDCRNFIDWLFTYYRGACLNYFKHNTNRLMPHSENKENRLLEFEIFSLDATTTNDGDETWSNMLVDETTPQSYYAVEEQSYNKYVINTICNYISEKFEDVNIDLFLDFYKLPFKQLENKYGYSMMNIYRYVSFIVTTLQTSNDFKYYANKYLYDVLLDKRLPTMNYTMYQSYERINIQSLLTNNIETEFSNTSMLSFEVGKDVKIHNYFREKFFKIHCI